MEHPRWTGFSGWSRLQAKEPSIYILSISDPDLPDGESSHLSACMPSCGWLGIVVWLNDHSWLLHKHPPTETGTQNPINLGLHFHQGGLSSKQNSKIPCPLVAKAQWFKTKSCKICWNGYKQPRWLWTLQMTKRSKLAAVSLAHGSLALFSVPSSSQERPQRPAAQSCWWWGTLSALIIP